MEVITGSDNIFADLDLPNPEERLAKARIAQHISLLLDDSRLTAAEIENRTHLAASDLHDIVRGDLERFSIDDLLRCLNALGEDVEIVIYNRASGKRVGHLSATTAMA